MSSSLKDSIALLLEASNQKIKNLPEIVAYGEYQLLPLDKLKPGAFQPRKVFNDEALNELAESIRSEGIIQPIVVRPLENNQYEIIAGERRWRASKLAGLQQIPAIIREICNETALAFGIMENLQREDLNPIEEAQAYHKLVTDFELTHEEVSGKVGKSRSYISNSIRLLNLPIYIQEELSNGGIQTGHAKLMLSVGHDKISEIFNKLIKDKLTIKQLENLINHAGHENDRLNDVDPRVLLMQDKISKLLKANCRIKLKDSGGARIVIDCDNLDVFEELLFDKMPG